MRGNLALVSGGSGFIGGHIVRHLLDQDRRVRILDPAAPPSDLRNRAEFIEGSVLDWETLGAAMSGVGEVYHAAGIAHLWSRDKAAFHRVNVDGTRLVLEAAKQAGVRRIVVTSSETVFYNPAGHLAAIDEDTPRRPLDEMPGPYCRSKHQAESLCLEAMAAGAPLNLLYPTLPIGPGDISLTPPTQMIADFLDGATPAYLDCLLNLVAVEDVALGHILAAQRAPAGARFILGNENLRLAEVLQVLHSHTGLPMPKRRVPYWIAYGFGALAEWTSDFLTGKQPVAPLAGVRLARHDMHFDCGKAVRTLGLRPTPVKDALARLIVWLQHHREMRRATDPVFAPAWNIKAATDN